MAIHRHPPGAPITATQRVAEASPSQTSPVAATQRVAEPPHAQPSFLADVLAGLHHPHKHLPCKYLYDQRGSDLFEQICQLDEYYPTRTELSILRHHLDAIVRLLGPDCLLIEYGSGSSLKTRLLLDHLPSAAGYVPIDISPAPLHQAARDLASRYPLLPIHPVCADYACDFPLPPFIRTAGRKVVFFPGSTIGNFDPPDALHFLRNVHHLCGPGGGLLIGIDLKKDPRLLHQAYNDPAGITAAFNLNLLSRINRELDADFVPDHFAHYAFFNAPQGRVEMHLVSLRDQSVRIAGDRIPFASGESIFTESSYKYTPAQFEQLTSAARFRLERIWQDDARLFALEYLTAV